MISKTKSNASEQSSTKPTIRQYDTGIQVITGVATELIADNKDAMKGLALMMNIENPMRAKMIRMGMREHNVTIDEAFKAFWKAYADPYAPSTGIEFRHLMKHVQEARDKQKYYSYATVLDMINKGIPMEEFICLNGKNGTQRIEGSNGKPLWKRIED